MVNIIVTNIGGRQAPLPKVQVYKEGFVAGKYLKRAPGIRIGPCRVFLLFVSNGFDLLLGDPNFT
jgi:hypothetical protein